MDTVLYAGLLAAFFTHEVDAVSRGEWRALPGLRRLPDAIGARVFIWAHLPVFLLLIATLSDSCPPHWREGLAGFAIIHSGMHWAFRNHPAYAFNNLGSWTLILLTAVLGAAYLWVSYGG
jgi:heme/copper-type cytochrome/quinol oxidase subunit 3